MSRCITQCQGSRLTSIKSTPMQPCLIKTSSEQCVLNKMCWTIFSLYWRWRTYTKHKRPPSGRGLIMAYIGIYCIVIWFYLWCPCMRKHPYRLLLICLITSHKQQLHCSTSIMSMVFGIFSIYSIIECMFCVNIGFSLLW